MALWRSKLSYLLLQQVSVNMKTSASLNVNYSRTINGFRNCNVVGLFIKNTISVCSSNAHTHKMVHTKDRSNFIESRSEQIYERLHSVNIKKHSMQSIIDICQFLDDLGIDSVSVEKHLLESPEFLDYPIRKWHALWQPFLDNGYGSRDVFQILSLAPWLFRKTPKELGIRLSQLQNISIGKLKISQFVSRNPDLIFMSEKDIQSRRSALQTYFPISDFRKLVENNPSVLTEDWEKLLAKIFYINDEMGLNQPRIMECSVLTHPLSYIVSRHEFLKRAGLYRKPNILRDKTSHLQNPKLGDIMDSSDKNFVNHIAQLPLEEYEVFKKLIKQEIIEDSDLEDSDESDSEVYQSKDSDSEDSDLDSSEPDSVSKKKR